MGSSKEYYQRNAEKIKAKSRAWSAANPERKRATRRAYYAKNKASIVAKSKEWERANPERKKERNRCRRLVKTFGISPAEYELLLEIQGYTCAICNGALDRGRKTHLDHNHYTGKVRAILCAGCNQGIGVLERDGGIWLAKAQVFLARQATVSVLETGLWRSE